MSVKLSTNGQRKSLAEQIDRLDSILDGLSEGLNDAVASVVQQAVSAAVEQAVALAVREAVHSVLTEILTNADLRAALLPPAQASAPAAPQKPAQPVKERLDRAWTWVKSTVQAIWAKVKELTQRVVQRTKQALATSWAAIEARVANACRRVSTTVQVVVAYTRAGLHLAAHLRRPLLTALGVGVTVGLGCYLSGLVVASTVSGSAGFVGSLAASALNTIRRALLTDLNRIT